MEIRKLSMKELPRIVDLVWETMLECGQAPVYTQMSTDKCKDVLEKIVRDDINDSQNIFYGMLHEKQLIGVVGIDLQTGFITYLYVSPYHQRKGIGTKLLDIVKNLFIKENKDTIYLNSTEEAITMYYKYGFRLNGKDKMYSCGMEYKLRRK